jgi:diapolycopene oxygenase
MQSRGAQKKVIVIGAGLGGLSAAISLATAGCQVAVYEKNDKIGGKLNVLQRDGFTFDLGPSILTLPSIFARLFVNAGRKMEDYCSIRQVAPHWRNFFEDGTVIDLHPGMDEMRRELAKADAAAVQGFEDFLAYARAQYELIARGYFERGLDTIGELVRFYKLSEIMRMDFLRSMDQSVGRFVRNQHLRNILDFFIKYVGSSARNAPGFMNLLPHVQFQYGLWYVDGGMYNLARGLGRLMQELGIEIHLNSEVQRIITQGDRAAGVAVAGGGTIDADAVVSNMEVIPAYERLLNEGPDFLRKLSRFEPACSGLVLHLGVSTTYPQLAHHNFFFSKDQAKHFDTVFNRLQLPEDPTIYLVNANKTDPTLAPPGHENIKILPHIPYINERHPYTQADYMALRERVLDKLERMGLTGLRRHIVCEDVWTPFDIQKKYYSNRGSIYGVVSDRWKNMAFKAPKQSSAYRNLFFVGGSVNPGGGMPMVVLCGQKVSEKVLELYNHGFGARR